MCLVLSLSKQSKKFELLKLAWKIDEWHRQNECCSTEIPVQITFLLEHGIEEKDSRDWTLAYLLDVLSQNQYWTEKGYWNFLSTPDCCLKTKTYGFGKS